MTYFGTELTPNEYYNFHGKLYNNLQSDAIKIILSSFVKHIEGKVIDIGCGSGLGTNIIYNNGARDISGIDNSIVMVERYNTETCYKAVLGNFWDKLPCAKTAIVIHALHLCPKSRIHEFKWRLNEAGVENLIITSPLKSVIANLNYKLIDSMTMKSGIHNKTVYGWVYSIKQSY